MTKATRRIVETKRGAVQNDRAGVHALYHSNPWGVWSPTASERWDVARVVHLHRRAGFGASWTEIQRDVDRDPSEVITDILQGRSRDTQANGDFDDLSEVISAAALGSDNSHRLKAWWMFRIVLSPFPLQERLTLLWHNHFATSNLKVSNLDYMLRQNQVMRSHAMAPFGELLRAVIKDPAILIWLDANLNEREHPNENLARELMELFTLGVGNYSESDVRESARALSGWTIRDGEFFFDEQKHDYGNKTILGRSGRIDGDDLIALLLEEPATATRLAKRLWECFAGESAVDEAAIHALGEGLREHDLSIAWGVETILRSNLFMSSTNMKNRVLGPIEYMVPILHALDCVDPPPSTWKLQEWATRLGQDLFYPPNVFGWPGGLDWLTSRSLIARANWASDLVQGNLHSSKQRVDLVELAERYEVAPELAVDFVGALLGLNGPFDSWARELGEALTADAAHVEQRMRILAQMLGCAEAQLG